MRDIRRHPGRVALCVLAVWAAVVTGTFLLLNTPPRLLGWAERQVPAIASLGDCVRSLVYRDYVF